MSKQTAALRNTGASRLDAVEYKNGQKNNWRLTAWNAISKTFKEDRVSKADQIVLYLPGETDLDSFVALRKGFRLQNLIAVEKNRKVVETLRSRRRTVIHADLVQVIANWPSHTPVGVVIADLQSGVTRSAQDIFCFWHHLSAFKNGVLLLNIQRGRESINDRGYQWFLEHTTFPGAPDFGTSRSASMVAIAIASAAARLGAKTPVELNEENLKLANRAIRWKILPSYRSSPTSPMFDSLLLRDNGVLDDVDGCDRLVDQLDDAVKRKIAAALAVRTMRMNGTLACI